MFDAAQKGKDAPISLAEGLGLGSTKKSGPWQGGRSTSGCKAVRGSLRSSFTVLPWEAHLSPSERGWDWQGHGTALAGSDSGRVRAAGRPRAALAGVPVQEQARAQEPGQFHGHD